ncbi:MAG: RNA polymerase sigma-70 factor [Adhaeribacter sp.]
MMHAFASLTDQELVARFVADGEPVFREIYSRYWQKLYVLAYRRLENSLEAEEIVQDVFCNLWLKRNSLVLSKGLANYLAVAVKYEVINRMAKQARVRTYLQAAASQQAAPDLSTLQSLDLEDLSTQLQLRIQALPEKCRLIFRLRHEEGYSQRQIATELQVSEKTVEAHLAKARKTLRASFGNLLGLLLILMAAPQSL